MIKKFNRKVHLDFHTSPLLEVGKEFDEENFKRCLKVGNVESVALFAKCHHGYCYYPTKVGEMHPKLTFDLLGKEIRAAHEVGVKTIIYIPIGWSEKDALEHPEWSAYEFGKNRRKAAWFDYDKTYAVAKSEDKRPGNLWLNLCVGTGYLDHLKALTKEICERYYPVDGIFYDICFGLSACDCPSCVKGMKEKDIDYTDKKAAQKYYKGVLLNMLTELTGIIEKQNPSSSVFFNGVSETGFEGVDYSDYHPFMTHYEMEELPTCAGDYDKLQIKSKYFERYGKPLFGMTGKFHHGWGEFGGFKRKESLKYEVANCLSLGMGCIIGDQLRPDGKMEEATYKNIGYAFDYMERVEDYCINTEPYCDFAVVLSEDADVNTGMTALLLEKHIDFDVVYEDSDMSKYSCVLVPEYAELSNKIVEKIKTYIRCGSNTLIVGDAAKFGLTDGLVYVGKSDYDNDYIQFIDGKDFFIDAPMLCNNSSFIVKAEDYKTIAEIKEPYFNRTYGHFCGHFNTPNRPESATYPAMAIKDNVLYISNPVFKEYKEYGEYYVKEYVSNGLLRLYRDGVVKVTGLPSCGRVRVRRRDKEFYAVHLLYAPVLKRGDAFVLEDMPDIYNVRVSVRIEEKIKGVRLMPQNEKLDYSVKDGRCEFVVEKFSCHQLVLVEIE